MTVLSNSDILAHLQSGGLKIEPFASESLSSAGYDLRSGVAVKIMPGGTSLVHTMETVELGPSICGQLFIRSSVAREGLLGSFALVDPGFRGQLTLLLANLGPSAVGIARGERLAQIVFVKLHKVSTKPYSGRYQNSVGTMGSKRGF